MNQNQKEKQKRNNLIKVILLLLAVSLSGFLYPQEESGENGGNNQTADNFGTNNNNSTVSSNNNTTATTNNYSGAGSSPGSMPVGSAIAPSLMSSGMDSCLMSRNGGLQVFSIGASAGSYIQDEECNRRRDAKVLKDLGMTVPAIALMCQNKNNWMAMFTAGTPCPILVNGRLVAGRSAYLVMKQNPELHIPNYGNIKQRKEVAHVCRRKKSTKEIINCDDEIIYITKPKYSKQQEYYNSILDIHTANENEEINNDTRSISERFRASLQPSG
jgi:hypothetical protein